MENKNYVQYSMSEFCNKFPNLRIFVPVDIWSDDRYVVRVSKSTGQIEFGFPGDCWHIR